MYAVALHMAQEIFIAKVCVMAILFAFVTWLVLHEVRLWGVEKKQLDDHLKIVKMEPAPNLEHRVKELEKEMDALRSNTFTRETLKLVHHDRH